MQRWSETKVCVINKKPTLHITGQISQKQFQGRWSSYVDFRHRQFPYKGNCQGARGVLPNDKGSVPQEDMTMSEQ